MGKTGRQRHHRSPPSSRVSSPWPFPPMSLQIQEGLARGVPLSRQGPPSLPGHDAFSTEIQLLRDLAIELLHRGIGHVEDFYRARTICSASMQSRPRLTGAVLPVCSITSQAALIFCSATASASAALLVVHACNGGSHLSIYLLLVLRQALQFLGRVPRRRSLPQEGDLPASTTRNKAQAGHS